MRGPSREDQEFARVGRLLFSYHLGHRRRGITTALPLIPPWAACCKCILSMWQWCQWCQCDSVSVSRLQIALRDPALPWHVAMEHQLPPLEPAAVRLVERFEPTIARTFQLLKRLLIEFLQKRRHSVIELSHIEKAMVAQCGQDLPLGDQNAPLHLRLIAGLLFAGRDDHGAIVFGQFLVTAVQQRFVTAGTNDPGLEIIRNRDSTDALKESPSMAMSSKPSAQLLVVEGLDIRLIAGAQHRHKQMARRETAVLCVVDRHRLTRPVHKHLLARLMDLTQHRLQSAGPALVKFAVAAVTITLRLGLSVFLPQQQQGYPLSTELLVDARPVRQSQGAHRCLRRTGDQPCQQLLFILPLWQRPTDSRRLSSFEVVPHCAGGQAAPASNIPGR